MSTTIAPFSVSSASVQQPPSDPVQLIPQLQQRIQTMEQRCTSLQLANAKQAQGYEDQLHLHAQHSESLRKQLETAQHQQAQTIAQLHQKEQELTALSKENDQNKQLIQNGLEEIKALTRQLNEEKNTIRTLTQQLSEIKADKEKQIQQNNPSSPLVHIIEDGIKNIALAVQFVFGNNSLT